MKEYLPFLALPLAFWGIAKLNEKPNIETGGMSKMAKERKALDEIEKLLKSARSEITYYYKLLETGDENPDELIEILETALEKIDDQIKKSK